MWSSCEWDCRHARTAFCQWRLIGCRQYRCTYLRDPGLAKKYGVMLFEARERVDNLLRPALAHLIRADTKRGGSMVSRRAARRHTAAAAAQGGVLFVCVVCVCVCVLGGGATAMAPPDMNAETLTRPEPGYPI